MRGVFMLAAIALVVATGQPGSAGGSDMRLLVTTRHARVTGRPETQQIAARVAALTDEAMRSIAPLVGTRDLRPIPIWIYADRRRFRAASGIPRTSTIVGLAKLPAGVIHIDGTGRLAAVERIVPHEVGHIMIGRALGSAFRAAPVWLNEGIAEHVAGARAARVDPVALRAIGRGRALPLARLDGAFRAGGESVKLAYAQSASIVSFLVSAHGEEVIAALLAALRESGSFAAALEKVTGGDESELEAAWRQSLARRWSLAMFVLSPVFLYAVMALLFLAGLLRFLRDRRRREEMTKVDR